jgi:hypothetical protein
LPFIKHLHLPWQFSAAICGHLRFLSPRAVIN